MHVVTRNMIEPSIKLFTLVRVLYLTRPKFVDMLHFILFDIRPNVPANAVLLLADITSRILVGVLRIQEILIPLFLR